MARMMNLELKKVYLFIYNMVCLSGWSAVFAILILFSSITKSYHGLYYLVETLVQFFQTFALLEVFHSIIGLVSSKPLYVMMQVFGRLFIVTSDIGAFLLILAWSITEIIRYSFYSWSIAHNATVPYGLMWLRYSAFIILYPIGVLGEILTTKSAFGYLTEWTLFPIPFGSSLIYFSMSHIVILLSLPYFIGFIFLYTYMVKQRSKVLNRARKYVVGANKNDLASSGIINKGEFTNDSIHADNGDNNLDDLKDKSNENVDSTLLHENSPPDNLAKPIKSE